MQKEKDENNWTVCSAVRLQSRIDCIDFVITNADSANGPWVFIDSLIDFWSISCDGAEAYTPVLLTKCIKTYVCDCWTSLPVIRRHGWNERILLCCICFCFLHQRKWSAQPAIIMKAFLIFTFANRRAACSRGSGTRVDYPIHDVSLISARVAQMFLAFCLNQGRRFCRKRIHCWSDSQVVRFQRFDLDVLHQLLTSWDWDPTINYFSRIVLEATLRAKCLAAQWRLNNMPASIKRIYKSRRQTISINLNLFVAALSSCSENRRLLLAC